MNIKIVALAALAICSCTQFSKDQEKYGLVTPARSVTLQSDSLEKPYTARFNRRGQLECVETRNFDGSFRFREDYRYNDKHELEEILGTNSDGDIEIRYEYEMDGEFVAECREYGMNNQEMIRWVHANDGKHIINSEYYNEGELQFIIDKTFTDSSYVEVSHSEEGELIGSAQVLFLGKETKPRHILTDELDIQIEYNDKGLPVMSSGAVLNSLGGMEWVPDLDIHPARYYSYEYDRHGNWITRYERKEPDSPEAIVLKRTIIY